MSENLLNQSYYLKRSFGGEIKNLYSKEKNEKFIFTNEEKQISFNMSDFFTFDLMKEKSFDSEKKFLKHVIEKKGQLDSDEAKYFLNNMKSGDNYFKLTYRQSTFLDYIYKLILDEENNLEYYKKMFKILNNPNRNFYIKIVENYNNPQNRISNIFSKNILIWFDDFFKRINKEMDNVSINLSECVDNLFDNYFQNFSSIEEIKKGLIALIIEVLRKEIELKREKEKNISGFLLHSSTLDEISKKLYNKYKEFLKQQLAAGYKKLEDIISEGVKSKEIVRFAEHYYLRKAQNIIAEDLLKNGITDETGQMKRGAELLSITPSSYSSDIDYKKINNFIQSLQTTEYPQLSRIITTHETLKTKKTEEEDIQYFLRAESICGKIKLKDFFNISGFDFSYFQKSFTFLFREILNEMTKEKIIEIEMPKLPEGNFYLEEFAIQDVDIFIELIIDSLLREMNLQEDEKARDFLYRLFRQQNESIAKKWEKTINAFIKEGLQKCLTFVTENELIAIQREGDRLYILDEEKIENLEDNKIYTFFKLRYASQGKVKFGEKEYKLNDIVNNKISRKQLIKKMKDNAKTWLTDNLADAWGSLGELIITSMLNMISNEDDVELLGTNLNDSSKQMHIDAYIGFKEKIEEKLENINIGFQSKMLKKINDPNYESNKITFDSDYKILNRYFKSEKDMIDFKKYLLFKYGQSQLNIDDLLKKMKEHLLLGMNRAYDFSANNHKETYANFFFINGILFPMSYLISKMKTNDFNFENFPSVEKIISYTPNLLLNNISLDSIGIQGDKINGK